MADAPWYADVLVDPLVAARGLVSRLDGGNPLPVLGDPLDTDGELVHVDVLVDASWHGPADVAYDDLQFHDFSGWASLAFTAAASAIGRHRAHAAADALAAPQWRPLGHAPTQALLTERRLVLTHSDGVDNVAYDEVEVLADLARRRVELWTDGSPRFALEGPRAPYLTVALVYLFTGEVLPSLELGGGVLAGLSSRP